MHYIAAFIDGPYHGTHAEVGGVKQEYFIARPLSAEESPRYSLASSELDPRDLYLTLQTGKYRRDPRPTFSNANVSIFRYVWAGWQ